MRAPAVHDAGGPPALPACGILVVCYVALSGLARVGAFPWALPRAVAVLAFQAEGGEL